VEKDRIRCFRNADRELNIVVGNDECGSTLTSLFDAMSYVVRLGFCINNGACNVLLDELGLLCNIDFNIHLGSFLLDLLIPLGHEYLDATYYNDGSGMDFFSSFRSICAAK